MNKVTCVILNDDRVSFAEGEPLAAERRARDTAARVTGTEPADWTQFAEVLLPPDDRVVYLFAHGVPHNLRQYIIDDLGSRDELPREYMWLVPLALWWDRHAEPLFNVIALRRKR